MTTRAYAKIIEEGNKAELSGLQRPADAVNGGKMRTRLLVVSR